MPLIAITPIKIPTKLAATLIILSPTKISANSTPTAPSTKKSTEPIVKDKHPKFIVH